VPEDNRPRFRHFFRCRTCANRFYVERLTADPTKVKTPRCPRKSCGGKARESHVADIGMDVSSGRAPGLTTVQAQAFDLAHKWQMEEQKVTNIRDNVRPGESSAPPLEPRLQSMADGFWGGNRQQKKTRTARADLSPIFGERATAAQAGAPVMGTRFTADNAPGVAPILTSKPPGTSPVPDHITVGEFNPK
jgi:hypothetical protein